MSSTVMAKFDIIGDRFSPEYVSRILGIVPTEIYIKGELTKRNLIRRNSCWRISTGYEISDDINNQLVKVLGKLQGKEAELNKLKGEIEDIDFRVVIVIKIFNNDKPSIYLNESTVRYIGELGASIDFDYYIVDNEQL